MENKTDFLANVFDWIGITFEKFNPAAFRFLSAFLPYLTPLPVAVMTSNSASQFLGFSKTMSGVFVLALEGMGLWFTSLLVDSVVDWIKSKNKKSFFIVLLFGFVVSIYVYILVSLNVTLERAVGDVSEELSSVITLLCFLPLLSGIGNGYYKLQLEERYKREKKDEEARHAEKENLLENNDYKLKRLALRQGINIFSPDAEESESFAKVSHDRPRDWRKLRPTLSNEDLIYLANASASELSTIAKEHGITLRTAQTWRGNARGELGLSGE